MMKLSPQELEYINQRLDAHDLKYQEVYDEIKDHVVLAMEAARANGDNRDIEYLYKDMMNKQFPGYYAFERIAIDYEKAYRAKIKKMVWANVRYYLSPLNIIVILLAITGGYYLPETKATYIILLVILLIAGVSPIVYARIKSANIKTDNGKQSIVKEHISNRAAVLFINYYVVMVCVDFFTHDGNFTLLNPKGQNPSVNLFLLAFAVIYGLSIARLCRQEITQPLVISTNL